MAALVLWIATAVGGITMAGIWVANGGPGAHSRGHSRLSSGRLAAHAVLAVSGLVLWILYVALDSIVPGVIAALLIAGAAMVGFLMFMTWLAGRGASDGDEAPEQRIPPVIVLGHGALAVLTVIAVLATLGT